MECFKCGISGDRVRLLDAISRRGIVRICKGCDSEEHLPLIRKPAEFQLKEVEEKSSVSEVLSRISGINVREKPKREISLELERQQSKLREIVEMDFKKTIQERRISTNHLVDNFHWIIMRIRRSRKMTQREFARAIDEPEAAVRMAEQGVISNPMLITKIENYLKIKLRKGYGLKESTKIESTHSKLPELEIHFDPTRVKEITVADLKEIKRKREKKILKKVEKERPLDERDLSDEEIDDLIFGKD